MTNRGRPRRRRRTTDVAWEMAFEAEVRQLSAQRDAELLRQLRHWRARSRPRVRSGPGRWPRRIFWVMDPTGGWYPLV
jgi:hypothetical protein